MRPEKWSFPPSADYFVVSRPDEVEAFAEGLQPVVIGLKTKYPPNAWGYLDTNGNFAIPPQFSQASPFSEGLASAMPRSGSAVRGYIDHVGKWVIPPQFDSAWPFSEGLAQATTPEQHLMGYIDPKGNWVITPQYPSESSYSNFSDGLACVAKKVEPAAGDTKTNPGPTDFVWGYIDKTGAQIIDFKFKEPGEFHEGLAAVKDAQGYGYIDKTGQFAFPERFLAARSFSEGLACVQTQGGLAYIDKQGKFAFEVSGLTGVRFAFGFSDGLAEVWVQDITQKSPNGAMHGFIDRTGKIAIPARFYGVSAFHDGLAQATDKDVTGYVNKTGHFVWQTKAPNLKHLLDDR